MKKVVLLLFVMQIIGSLLFAGKMKVGNFIGTGNVEDGLMDSPIYSLKLNKTINNEYDLVFKFENFNVKQDYYVAEFQRNSYRSNLKNYLIGFEYKSIASKKVTNILGFYCGIGRINQKLYVILPYDIIALKTSWVGYTPVFEINLGFNYKLKNKQFLYFDSGYRYENFSQSSFGLDTKYNRYKTEMTNVSGLWLGVGLGYNF